METIAANLWNMSYDALCIPIIDNKNKKDYSYLDTAARCCHNVDKEFRNFEYVEKKPRVVNPTLFQANYHLIVFGITHDNWEFSASDINKLAVDLDKLARAYYWNTIAIPYFWTAKAHVTVIKDDIGKTYDLVKVFNYFFDERFLLVKHVL